MDEKVQKKLHDLFIAYSKNLPEKIRFIESQWLQLLQHWDLILFQNFHRDVHSLCGSAGTYGYTELSKSARRLEIYLKNLLNKPFLSVQQQEKITFFLYELNAVLNISTPAKLPIFETKCTPQIENKLIYIMEQDSQLVHALRHNLEHIGYSTLSMRDLHSLQMTVAEKVPVAIIIDTDYLNKTEIEMMLLMQKDQQSPIQLFCIVPNGDLSPRLRAIRAGCDAFFQKPVDIYFLTKILNQKCSLITQDPYRILIIDDSESLTEYYSLILNQAGMVTSTITNPMLLLQEIEMFHPDLLLMDIYMPECTGLELAAVLRQESNYTKIPIIFLSTEDDKRKQLSALNLGKDDFLTKPVSPPHLISAVKSRAKRAGILNHYMVTDSLTGLLNHSNILKRLDIELAHANQNNLPLSFIMIDIDHFKKINDNYGHPMGDIVIKKLATLFSIRFRSQDIIGRYGGEEFAIILPATDSQQSQKICTELMAQFSQYKFTTSNSNFSVTFSAGISAIRAENNSKAIVIEADLALYKAKQLGRNQVVIFDKSISI